MDKNDEVELDNNQHDNSVVQVGENMEPAEITQPLEAVSAANSVPTTETHSPAADPLMQNRRDYDLELAAKDAEIKRLNEAWLDSKNSHHMTRDEIKRAQVSLAEAVQEREAIVAAKDRALSEITEQLETVSQATQTLTKERTELSGELEQARAKATKLEILTEEFPELLRYSKLIPASSDPETIRLSCRALSEARRQDMEAQRISAITGNPMNAMPSAAARVDVNLTDPEKMRSFLEEVKGNPQEYERRRQLLLDQFSAAVARGQSS